MKFSLPRALKRLSILALLLPAVALAACASRPVAFLDAQPCSQLVPEGWWCKEGQDPTPEKPCGVPAAEPPEGDAAGDWVAYGDAQGGQLDKANGRGTDTMTIVQKCEAWHKEAADALKPKGMFGGLKLW